MQRVHLLDGIVGGVVLLELFKRDGMGTMVARFVSFLFQASVYLRLWVLIIFLQYLYENQN